MSAERDSLGRLAADLTAYLRQQQQAGAGWFVEDAPAEGGAGGATAGGEATAAAAPLAAVESATAPPPVARPAAPISPATPAPAPASRPVAPSPEPVPRGGDFAAVCAAFVQDTLARLESGRKTVAQGDIFAAPEEAPERLTSAQKAEALAELAAEVAPCRGCKLAPTRTQTVFGVGDPDADLVFVGEAPGRDEDRQGEPFVGRAGQLLNEILKAIEFRREDVYICNILKCRPPENRDPERDEVEACEPYLRRQLALIEPKVICCLGRHAAQTLLNTTAALSALRERTHFYQGIPVVVTFHPAALLRNPHWKRPTWDDVRKLRALYDALRGGGQG